jgi:hypothetical protein
MKKDKTETKLSGKLSDASTCSQSRFDNWTREDYEREKKRISRQLRHFEAVIPKLKRAQRYQEMKAFDPAI